MKCCEYCKAECKPFDGPISPTRHLYECVECHAYFNTTADDVPIYSSWRISIKDKKYFISSYHYQTGNAPEFIIAYLATNPEGKQYWEEVHRFNFIPNWTPQDSAHKLSLYLPFL